MKKAGLFLFFVFYLGVFGCTGHSDCKVDSGSTAVRDCKCSCSDIENNQEHQDITEINQEVGGDLHQNDLDVIEEDAGHIPVKCEQPLKPIFLSVLHAENGNLIDSEGRIVYLKGINLSGIEGGAKGAFKKADIDAIAHAGFNAIRLPIGWSGLEPQKDVIDQEYIDQIKDILNWAQQDNIYVMVDMHQWYWCRVGMPKWTCTEKPELDFNIVFREASRFWSNEELKNTLIKRWVLVAKQIKDYRSLLGYDLFNEPVPSDVNNIMDFDKNTLTDFYLALIKALRGVDLKHIIVIEPNILQITGVSYFDRLKGIKNMAYSPHYYCPHTYSEEQGLIWLISPSEHLLRAQYEQGEQIRERYGWPILVGEYGFPEDKGTLWLDTSLDWQEEYYFSSFYWDYRGSWGIFKNRKLKDFYKDHLLRPYVEAVAGRNVRFRARAWSGWLDVEYDVTEDDLCKTTQIVLPAPIYKMKHEITFSGPLQHYFDPKTHRLLIRANNTGHIHIKIR